MIEHHVVMRYGDIDANHHLNNVHYLDYAAEGRAALVAAGLLPSNHGVARLEADYRAPMFRTRDPIVVTNEVDGDAVLQEICADGPDGRTVYARVVTRLGAPAAPRPVREAPGVLDHDVPIRLSDLGERGVVQEPRVAELVQELRVAHDSACGRRWGPALVARVEVDLVAPIRRDVPVTGRTWVSGFGRSSFVMRCELRAGGEIVACGASTLVVIDKETQRSREITAEERTVFVVVPDEA